MTEHIKYEDVIDDNSTLEKHVFNTKKKFATKIIHFHNVYGFNEILVNARVGILLPYNSAPLNTTFPTTLSSRPYPSGTLAGINVSIDPMMTWNDNRIIIRENKLLLRKMKLDKILKRNNSIRYLDEIIIDEKILDILL